jgi:predicted PurR-regulated permease PerM
MPRPVARREGPESDIVVVPEGPRLDIVAVINRWVELLAAYAWRLLVIAAAAVGVLWLVAEMWVAFAALAVAVLLTRALAAPRAWLGRRLPRGAAAGIALLGLLVVGGGVVAGISVAVAGQLSDLGPTVSEAIDDIEEWVVEESPFDVSRADIDEFRASLGERFSSSVRDSSGSIVSGALVAAEVGLSLLLALIITFFALKDGDRFVAWVRGALPAEHRPAADRIARRAWATLGGYLRGAALLGVVEGTIIAITLWLVGAELAVPMGVLTLVAAFVPFAGAIAAGAVAVLVALATGGVTAAVVVLVVALVVQQVDNDLLAPVVYGRALDLHPVVILLAITGGAALFGIAGGVLAVPVVAVAWNAVAEARRGDLAERSG